MRKGKGIELPEELEAGGRRRGLQGPFSEILTF